MATRFSGNKSHTNSGDIHVYKPPPVLKSCKVQTAGVKRTERVPAFPFGFEPTFYPNRLPEPSTLRKPSTIFVGSMCDMWGDWVPMKWQADIIFEAAMNPEHRYLFLTKNPSAYYGISSPQYSASIDYEQLDFWYGASITTSNDAFMFSDTMFTLDLPHKYFSAEPLLEDIAPHVEFNGVQWLIIGARTKNGRVVPPEQGGTRPEWVEALVEKAQRSRVPVFIKDSVYKQMWPHIPYDVWLRALPYLEGK